MPMWGYADGWSWLWMAAITVLFWAGLIALGVLVSRFYTEPKGDDPGINVPR
jgi:hypothetical protein